MSHSDFEKQDASGLQKERVELVLLDNKGFRQEWYIFAMLYCRDIPLWLETLDKHSHFQFLSISRVPDRNGVSQT